MTSSSTRRTPQTASARSEAARLAGAPQPLAAAADVEALARAFASKLEPLMGNDEALRHASDAAFAAATAHIVGRRDRLAARLRGEGVPMF